MRAAGRHRKQSDTIPLLSAVVTDVVLVGVGVTAGLAPLAAGTMAAVASVATLITVRHGSRARRLRLKDTVSGNVPVVPPHASGPPPRQPPVPGPAARVIGADVRGDLPSSASDPAAGSIARSLPCGAAGRRGMLLFEASSLLAQLRWEHDVSHRSRVWIEDVLPALGAHFDDEIVARDVLAACALDAGGLEADLWIVDTTGAEGAVERSAEELCAALGRLLAQQAPRQDGDKRASAGG